MGRAGPCALPGARAAVVPRLRRGAPAVRRVRERVLPGRPRVAGRGGAVRPGGHPRLPRGQQGRRGGEQGGVLQRGAGAGRGPRRALPRGVGQDGGGRPAALPRRRGGAAGPGRAPAARAARAGPRVVALRRRLGFARPSRRPSRGSFSSWARGAEPRELEGGAFGWAPLRRQAAQRSGGPGELRRRVPARPGPCPPAAGRRCAPCAQRAAARRGQARTAPASSIGACSTRPWPVLVSPGGPSWNSGALPRAWDPWTPPARADALHPGSSTLPSPWRAGGRVARHGCALARRLRHVGDVQGSVPTVSSGCSVLTGEPSLRYR
ncbi:unnamed protein product [Prorocentrum cordatum]|uniref:Uncharacterized protein n=1 Tax=Prorocentrum cordatum TaxID=2364126 RepID=A0ABN9SPN8_9DINO|nr:unnamed protein product [Polarella glacialis]